MEGSGAAGPGCMKTMELLQPVPPPVDKMGQQGAGGRKDAPIRESLNCAMENLNTDTRNTMDQGLAINELLQVQVAREPNAVSYRSRIENIVDGKILAAWPTSNGIRLPVHRDQILDFSLVRDGNAYVFTGMVDSTSSEPLPCITVIVSSAIEQVQRRHDFRIKCLIPVEVSGNIRTSSKSDAPEPLHLKTTTYDISASGLSIRNAKMIPDGSLLDIKIGLPDGESMIRVPCRVAYCEVSRDNARLYHSGIQFLAISEREKARIVRYVYRTQLKGMRS